MRSGRRGRAPLPPFRSTGLCTICRHASSPSLGLVQQLDHVADEDRLGPALQTRLVRGLDEPAEPLHAVARVVAPTSVLARGRSVDADEPRSSALLPPAFHNRLSRSCPPGATLAALLYPMRRRLSSSRESRAPPGCRPRSCFARSTRSLRDAGCGALGTDHRALLPLRGDALRQDLASRSQETPLTLLFVPIDANICHGWSSLCGMDRVMACGDWATTCG
jgi:hypothetical protein